MMACAALCTIAFGMPVEPVKEAADVTKPAMAPAPAAQPAAEQPSEADLAKLRQQLEAIGQTPAEEGVPAEEALEEQAIPTPEMPETKPVSAEEPSTPEAAQKEFTATEEAVMKPEGMEIGMAAPTTSEKTEEAVKTAPMALGTKPAAMPGEEQKPMAKPEEMPVIETGVLAEEQPAMETEGDMSPEETEDISKE